MTSVLLVLVGIGLGLGLGWLLFVVMPRKRHSLPPYSILEGREYTLEDVGRVEVISVYHSPVDDDYSRVHFQLVGARGGASLSLRTFARKARPWVEPVPEEKKEPEHDPIREMTEREVAIVEEVARRTARAVYERS